MVDEALGLNNPDAYVLTHNRFNTYLVSIYSDLSKAQVHIMPCRVSSHYKIEILMSFKFLNVLKLNEHIQDY